jgi:hypothetical protein
MLHTLQYNLGQEPQHQLPLGLTPADTPPQRRLGP